MPNYSQGIAAPVPLSSPQRAGNIATLDEASNILSLVNVGRQVLDISSLDQDPAALIKLASSIIASRRAGAPVEFANGRINVPEELFTQLVSASRSHSVDAGQIGMSSTKDTLEPKQQQNLPLFAPPPPVFEKQRRKERTKMPQAQGTVPVSDDAQDEDIPCLTASQAYHILVDIVPPGGGKYVIHVKGKYEDSKEDKDELEKGLDGFWKDYGQNMSVNAKLTSFTVKPLTLIGNTVNPAVSKRLIVVFVSQSTREKIGSERIIISKEKVLLAPSTGELRIELFDRQLIELLMGVQNPDAEQMAGRASVARIPDGDPSFHSSPGPGSLIPSLSSN